MKNFIKIFVVVGVLASAFLINGRMFTSNGRTIVIRNESSKEFTLGARSLQPNPTASDYTPALRNYAVEFNGLRNMLKRKSIVVEKAKPASFGRTSASKTSLTQVPDIEFTLLLHPSLRDKTLSVPQPIDIPAGNKNLAITIDKYQKVTGPL